MRSVERCRIADLPDSMRSQFDSHSFFGSTGFARVWESIGGTAVCWMLVDKESVIAALTGVEFRGRPLTRFQAMPDGCYARLYTTARAQDERVRLGQELMSGIERTGYAGVYVADYFHEFGVEDDAGARQYETLVVDISTPNWRPPDAKLQSEIRKAEREGVVFSKFSVREQFDGFMRLMAKTEQRHERRPRYTREFFLKLAELAALDDRIRWLQVERDGSPVVSHIYLVEQTMALNWQIYFDKGFSHLKANQYLMYTAAKSLAASGVKYLNLGATPPDADSLRSYKEKWGGVAHTYSVVVRKSWLGRVL
jgi:hypothetical protein